MPSSPSSPDTSDVRLRPLGSPSPLRVRTDPRGRPVEVCRPGRRGGSKVVSIHEIWRIDDEWWRRPVSRLYYRVVLENGKMMAIYRDLTEGRWYAQ